MADSAPAGGIAPVIVAIPAKNEAERIVDSLAAFALQRDGAGRPLPAGTFSVLVYANDCTDETAAEVRRCDALSPHRIEVVCEQASPGQGNAGQARRRAMDIAAERLDVAGLGDGILLTTDADTCVALDWVAATLCALAAGADAVAGYVDGQPAELLRLGAAFLGRGRLEDAYLSRAAEIDACCDPRPHNPWPTHRVSSGASLALTLAAYRAIGGLPAVPLGEDIALTRMLERHGFKVRHAMDVVVSTSCRIDGRAAGGAADTMRERHIDPDAGCDEGIEPAILTLRRAAAKGRLRRMTARDAAPPPAALCARLGLAPRRLAELIGTTRDWPFPDRWDAIEQASPALARPARLRPSDLPAEITRADRILRRLRALARPDPTPHALVGSERSSRSSR